MFSFAQGSNSVIVVIVWITVLVALFVLNEIARRSKTTGFIFFIILPVILSILWFTVLRDKTYLDWFHLAKVYSSTAGCIGFWCIRFLKGKKKNGEVWKLSENKLALSFPAIILAINILEAVARDFQVGAQYSMPGGGILVDEAMHVIGGSWNYMNGIAGILNIITITGWFGIVIRKETKTDKSKDMLWPDMLWFWIIAYDLWNFAYTYNCLPGHSWYCGLALLIPPTVCAFTIGKGAWLQHRAQTLALWCMFAQTFPLFLDEGKLAVQSTYHEPIYFIVSLIALMSNIAVIGYMLFKILKTKRNPYKEELYTDLQAYKKIKLLAE